VGTAVELILRTPCISLELKPLSRMFQRRALAHLFTLWWFILLAIVSGPHPAHAVRGLNNASNTTVGSVSTCPVHRECGLETSGRLSDAIQSYEVQQKSCSARSWPPLTLRENFPGVFSFTHTPCGNTVVVKFARDPASSPSLQTECGLLKGLANVSRTVCPGCFPNCIHYSSLFHAMYLEPLPNSVPFRQAIPSKRNLTDTAVVRTLALNMLRVTQRLSDAGVRHGNLTLRNALIAGNFMRASDFVLRFLDFEGATNVSASLRAPRLESDLYTLACSVYAHLYKSMDCRKATTILKLDRGGLTGSLQRVFVRVLVQHRFQAPSAEEFGNLRRDVLAAKRV
jgi:hypothetical protein